jgi:hypothetical protein
MATGRFAGPDLPAALSMICQQLMGWSRPSPAALRMWPATQHADHRAIDDADPVAATAVVRSRGGALVLTAALRRPRDRRRARVVDAASSQPSRGMLPPRSPASAARADCAPRTNQPTPPRLHRECGNLASTETSSLRPRLSQNGPRSPRRDRPSPSPGAIGTGGQSPTNSNKKERRG